MKGGTDQTAKVLAWAFSMQDMSGENIRIYANSIGSGRPAHLNSLIRHSFARNRQLPFLNQRKRENDRRKYFMTKSPRKTVADPAMVGPATS